MSGLETRPMPPETPVFSNQMAGFLVATARANRNPVRRTSPLVPVVGVVVALAIAVGATIALSRSDAPRTLTARAVHVHLAAFWSTPTPAEPSRSPSIATRSPTPRRCARR